MPSYHPSQLVPKIYLFNKAGRRLELSHMNSILSEMSCMELYHRDGRGHVGFE